MTTIVTVVVPTFKLIEPEDDPPFTETVAWLSLTVGDTVMEDTLFPTLAI